MTFQLVAVIVTLVLHTGALFYWGGGIRQMLKEHDRRIEKAEQRIDRLMEDA